MKDLDKLFLDQKLGRKEKAKQTKDDALLQLMITMHGGEALDKFMNVISSRPVFSRMLEVNKTMCEAIIDIWDKTEQTKEEDYEEARQHNGSSLRYCEIPF